MKENRKANKEVTLKIGQTCGRPLILDVWLNSKLWGMIISLSTAATRVNQHVVRGVLIGLVQAYRRKFGKYVNLEVTQSWVRSLYQQMKFSRRVATTSIPVITSSFWNEIKCQFLHEISQKVLLHSIPHESIINADQTPLDFVAADNIIHGSHETKAYLKSRFQWQKKYYFKSFWINWW